MAMLYRYFGSHVLDTVRDKRLKVSKLADFNDPFEGMYYLPDSITVKEARNAAKKRLMDPLFHLREGSLEAQLLLPQLAQHIKSNYPRIRNGLQSASEDFKTFFRVVSFSSSTVDPVTEIVMWSHYANQHGGMRIGFEFPAKTTAVYSVKEVIYSSDRVMVRMDDSKEDDGANLWRAYYTKSVGWEYEKEFRLITRSENCEKMLNGSSPVMEFFCFNPGWIKLIDFGVKCPDERMNEVVDLVRDKHPHIKLRRARFHQTEFALTYSDLS